MVDTVKNYVVNKYKVTIITELFMQIPNTTLYGSTFLQLSLHKPKTFKKHNET